jgi:hypothetical protein
MNWLVKLLNSLCFEGAGDSGIGAISDLKELESKDDDKEGDSGGDKEDSGKGEDEGDEDKEDKDEDKEEKGDEEEDEEKEELEEDEKLEEEEEEEETVARASEIKKEFPDFFKKFPEVRAAIYRDQQYSEIFGNPKDAAVAAERSELLAQIEKDIIEEGDPEKLLKSVSESNKESFEKVAFRVLPYLQANHKDLYYEVAATPIKQLLRAAWREGRGKETDLGRAAAFIHKFFFGDYEFDAKTKGEAGKFGLKGEEKESQEKREYRERLQQLEQREYDDFSRSVDASYVNKMSKFIREALDKDERLGEYTKTKLVEDILSGVKNQLAKDPRHINQLRSLFKQARMGGYSSEFKSRIINTALARAKSLVPSLRSRLVAEALGKANRKNGKEEEGSSRENRENRPRFSGRGSERSSERNSENRGQPKKPLTDLDILRAR